MTARQDDAPAQPPVRLPGSTGVLAEVHDVALLDLDGVVYLGGQPVPHAAQALSEARARGMRLAFVTNNASRTPTTVAEQLGRLGVPASAADVVTSAQAAAHLLADRFPRGSRVLMVGGRGLEEALRERGLDPVRSAEDDPVAVVQGFAPEVDWRSLAEAAIAVGRGLPWLATNADLTVPTARGTAPGNGTLVQAVTTATGVVPEVAGKPRPPLHRETVERTGARRPLVVGDRLDTDIEGAHNVGCESLLVLTGVTTEAQLLAAERHHRPTYVARDLRGLLVHYDAVVRVDGGYRCGAWTVRSHHHEVVLTRAASADGDRWGEHQDSDAVGPVGALQALRALCAVSWDRVDRSEAPLGVDALAAVNSLRGADHAGR